MHAHTNSHYKVHNVWHIQNRDHRRRGSFKSNKNRVTSGHSEFQVPVILEGNIQSVHVEGCLCDGPGCSTSSYSCPWIIPSPERDWAKWFASIEENMAKVTCWHFQNYNKSTLLARSPLQSCSVASWLPNGELPKGEAYGARPKRGLRSIVSWKWIL